MAAEDDDTGEHSLLSVGRILSMVTSGDNDCNMFMSSLRCGLGLSTDYMNSEKLLYVPGTYGYRELRTDEAINSTRTGIRCDITP